MRHTTITPVLAAGSTASPYSYQLQLSRTLCKEACSAQTPVFNPRISMLGFAAVSSGNYVATLRLEGLVSYVPCGQEQCCTKSELVSEVFTVPFTSTTAPTSVAVAVGTAVNTIVRQGCRNCSRAYTSSIPMTLTIA